MATVGTYLNFSGETDAAFLFYQTVFGGEFLGGISRFGDMPSNENMPPMPDDTKAMVLHVCLPILNGFRLMGSDAQESMGFMVNKGNNVYIDLDTDSREQTDQLFNALSEGGTVSMPLGDMFWGAYFGSCTDKFGVQWMFSFSTKNPYA